MAVNKLDAQCIREDLLLALQAAEAVVPSNSIKKILTNLRLDVVDDHMVVSATDQQIGLRALVRRVKVAEPGSILVPAHQLVSILKESSSPDVRLWIKDSKDSQLLEISLQDGTYHLPVFASEEFPAISGFPEQATGIPVPGDVLEQMIKRTIFGVDKDRSSAVLSGVYCALSDGQLLMTATDGKVLAEARYSDASYEQLPDMTLVIPALTVNHIARMLGSGQGGEVALAMERGLIFVRAVITSQTEQVPVQVEMTSRLVEGVYPAYRNAIPSQSESAVSFVTSELASAVRRTALMTSNANRGIVLDLNKDRAQLSNFSHSTGTAEIPVACQYDGATRRIGLNAQYLREVLRVYTRDQITIELNGAGRGMLMRDDNVTFLIMPITLPN